MGGMMYEEKKRIQKCCFSSCTFYDHYCRDDADRM